MGFEKKFQLGNLKGDDLGKFCLESFKGILFDKIIVKELLLKFCEAKVFKEFSKSHLAYTILRCPCDFKSGKKFYLKASLIESGKSFI